MTAKEMFENLGYSLEVNSEDLIKYSKEVCGYTFFRFRLKDKEFCSGYQSIAHTTTRNELEAVIQQFKELGWIEEEKPQETNLDHYKYDIVEHFMDDLAMVDKKIGTCQTTSCSDCEFSKENGECIGKSKIRKWFDQPYEKPKYKLTQCEYDMLDTIFGKESIFSKVYLIGELKKRGYFENIKYDSNVRVKDILANCEVIE